MTVTYTAEVATCRGFGCFWKLLFRWRGSIYKLLWPELTVYIVFYFTLSFVYRFVLEDEPKRYFEKIARYCDVYADLIPVTFILGFYVSIVLKRWWDQFISIPWPDPLALFVSASIHGQDDRGRLMRRTIMRYVNLSLVMTLTCISPRVKKRFPTLDHLQEAGILLPNEKKIIEDLNNKTPQYPKHWMPLVWASSIVTRARKEGRIRDDFAVKTLIDELCSFRGQCGGLFIYDWISIPLVYTQVVTLAVYTFFFATVMGRQYLDPDQGYPRQEIDLYIPIFTFLQFFFYMGWLKVAETLVNPFGEDDDDFEMNWLIDRNIQVSYLIVDEIHQEHPELIKDQYWDEVMPQELPYTAATEQYRREPPKGSAADISIPDDQAEFIPMETVVEDPITRSGTSCKDIYSNTPTEFGCSMSDLHRSHNRPSMMSIIQRFFGRDNQAQMGSSNSISETKRKSSRKPSISKSTLSNFSEGITNPQEDDDEFDSILSFTARNCMESVENKMFSSSNTSLKSIGSFVVDPPKTDDAVLLQIEEPVKLNVSKHIKKISNRRSHWLTLLDNIIPIKVKNMARTGTSQSQPNIVNSLIKSNEFLYEDRLHTVGSTSSSLCIANAPTNGKFLPIALNEKLPNFNQHTTIPIDTCVTFTNHQTKTSVGLVQNQFVENFSGLRKKSTSSCGDEKVNVRRNSVVGELKVIAEKGENV